MLAVAEQVQTQAMDQVEQVVVAQVRFQLLQLQLQVQPTQAVAVVEVLLSHLQFQVRPVVQELSY
jgi:hypothetical protein